MSLDQEFYAGRFVAALGAKVEEDPERAEELESQLSDCKAESLAGR